MSSRSLRVPTLVLLLACSHAHAQEAAQPSAPEASAPEASALAATESVEASEARAAVARAKALVAVENYGAALAEYTRALELLEGDPRQAAVLNNIAVCYERMFRYDLALQYYEAYLREADASAEDRAEVEQIVASLRGMLGTVRITGMRAGEVWINNRMLGEVAVDVLVPSGVHVIEVRARGYHPERRELRVTAQKIHHLHIELERIEVYRGLPSTYFWIGTGLTAAAAITGAALGIAALAQDREGDRDAARGYWTDGQKAKDLALQADIAFGIATAFGVGTVVLAFLTDWGSSNEDRGAAKTRVGFGVTSSSFALSLEGQAP